MSNPPLYYYSHEKGHSEPPQKGYAKIILQILYIFIQWKVLSKSWLEDSDMNQGRPRGQSYFKVPKRNNFMKENTKAFLWMLFEWLIFREEGAQLPILVATTNISWFCFQKCRCHYTHMCFPLLLRISDSMKKITFLKSRYFFLWDKPIL